MTSTEVPIVKVDPADLKAADAKALAVREGEETWKVGELRTIVVTLNADVDRLVEEFHASEHDLDDLLHLSLIHISEPTRPY